MAWDYVADCTVFPEYEGWTRFIYGPVTYELVGDGTMRIFDPLDAADALIYWRRIPGASVATVEARLRVVSAVGHANYYKGHQNALIIGNGTDRMYFLMADDGLAFTNGNAGGHQIIANVDMTVWRTVRLIRNNNDAEVYVDGSLVWSGQPPRQAAAADYIIFGDSDARASGETYWDYVYADLQAAIPPEPPAGRVFPVVQAGRVFPVAQSGRVFPKL